MRWDGGAIQNTTITSSRYSSKLLMAITHLDTIVECVAVNETQSKWACANHLAA